jgi:subtilisin family serine protease
VLLLSRRGHFAVLVTSLGVGALLTFAQFPAAYATPEPVKPALPAPLPGRYIVTLTDKPIATYGGDVKGLRATRPNKGERVDTKSGRAKRYRAYLSKQQANAAARVGAKPLKHYSVSLNGFSTSLTPDQARTLQRAPGVLAVTKDRPRKLVDNKNPVDFLKLSGSNGVWAALGGKQKAGQGVVVGILDSGYWPESKSFAGEPLDNVKPTTADPFRPYRSGNKKIIMHKADGGTFTGTCQTGESFTGDECNTKVIGARYFSSMYESQTPASQRTDYLSPRDGDGHGTHVASTAAGNAGVSASVAGHSFGKISGVAPAAKLAIYKVGFTSKTDEGAVIYNGDAVAAIDAAISDGVDVINYSVSSSDAVNDPVDWAFMSAASAGIFVATAAGNEGPGKSTLNHVTPWMTTVGASTVAPYAGTVVLGNGKKYAGISTTVFGKVGPARLVTGRSVKKASATNAEADICAPDSLSRGKAAGKIVVCDRGVVTRVEKSAEVKRVGGKGIVLVNLTENSTDGDTHAVPTVHLNVPYGPAVKKYAKKSGATATLREGNRSSTPIRYPQISSFSSRGPSVGNGGDLLKPDVAAPGVSVLAAVAPPSNENRKFDFYSGTSMASPHVAGIAALYFGVYPKWSPMAVKSAIMTTASRVKKANGKLSRDYFAQGAGNVRPDRMFNPGLIFDAGERDWWGFLEGEGFHTESGARPIDPSDYNSPSIAIGKLVGSQTVTRKLTAVKPGSYQATISVPGVTATVNPSVVNFSSAGETKTVKITLTRKAAPFSKAIFGSLKFVGAGTVARLPVVVVPQAAEAPNVVKGTGASGSVSFQVTPGFDGSFPITVHGLATAAAQPGEVAKGGTSQEFDQAIPAGTKLARFAVAANDSRADIDLEVYRVVGGEFELAGFSATESGTEKVDLINPAAGDYVAVVLPFADPPGASSTAFTYRGFVVGSNVGNLSVDPADGTASSGVPFPVKASWSGLSASAPYLGVLSYVDGSATVVEIN